MHSLHRDQSSFDQLLELVTLLREHCPWDQQQNFQSLRKHTLEEVHEVLESIDAEDWPALQDELGDLLFQIVFYAKLCQESKGFDIHDVIDALIEKMIYRHPHVFAGSDANVDMLQQWDRLKDAKQSHRSSLMDGIPPLPALSFAAKLQQRAARIGFDWDQASDVLPKMREELQELSDEIEQQAPIERIEDEFGDLLFVLANIARKLNIDAELCLMRSNRKFMQRFRGMEALAEQAKVDLSDYSKAELEAVYQQSKALLQKGDHNE